jgi:2-C-methyl-D-erythritol 2,4-cyclodiphosphate synthase
VSITIEGKRPKFEPHIEEMKKNIAGLLSLQASQIGITATSGEGLTAFGRGDGLQVFVVATAADEALV